VIIKFILILQLSASVVNLFLRGRRTPVPDRHNKLVAAVGSVVREEPQLQEQQAKKKIVRIN